VNIEKTKSEILKEGLKNKGNEIEIERKMKECRFLGCYRRMQEVYIKKRITERMTIMRSLGNKEEKVWQEMREKCVAV